MNKYKNANRKLYNLWRDIKHRCYTTSSSNYKYYGARGIRVCQEWLKDYFVFENWALNNGYQLGLQIDRKDNNFHYCPVNCRFVTKKQNFLNRRVRSNSKSGYKGVFWQNHIKKWRVVVVKDGVRHECGLFTDPVEAAKKYNIKAKELHGEFACLNEV